MVKYTSFPLGFYIRLRRILLFNYNKPEAMLKAITQYK